MTEPNTRGKIVVNIVAGFAVYVSVLAVLLTVISLSSRVQLFRLLGDGDVTWVGRELWVLSLSVGRARLAWFFGLSTTYVALVAGFALLRLKRGSGLLPTRTAFLVAAASVFCGALISVAAWYFGFVEPFSGIMIIIR